MGDLEWMAWTPGTAMFIGGVLAGLVGLTVIALVWPSVPRKGFLPMATARGDRIYVGLLGMGLVHIVVIALTGLPIPVILVFASVWMVVVLVWG